MSQKLYFIYDINTGVIIDKAKYPVFYKRRNLDTFLLACEYDDPFMTGAILHGDKYYLLSQDTKYGCQCFEDDDIIFTKDEKITGYDDIIIGYTQLSLNLEDDSGLYFKNDIKQIQKDKQEENKAAFNNYLLAHPYEYNGKQYGTTLQDQLEINLMLSQAQAMTIDGAEPQVEWHATTEVNESMSVSDLLAIQAGIKNAVAASYKKMQEYKKAIFDCTDAKTLVEMSFEYEEGKNA